MSKSHRLIVGADQDNTRLDVYLASTGLLSRRKARDLLAAGAVYLNRHRVKVASRIVRAGNQVELYLPETIPPATTVVVPILYRDDAIVVVNKPAGMPVQPTRESDRGTVLEALERQLDGACEAPRIVHRLDRDTSGVVVLALTRGAAAGLSAQMAAHSAGRIYLAATVGEGQAQETLRHYLSPLLKPHPADGDGPVRVEARPQQGSARPLERPAVTHTRRLAHAPGYSLLKVRLETGLTHQIRAQLSAAGLPLVGDTRYGAPPPAADSPLQRPALHAATLRLVHPTTGATMTWFAPVPDDLRQWLQLHHLWLAELEAGSDQSIPLLTQETPDGQT